MNKQYTLKLEQFLNESLDDNLNLDIKLLDDIVNIVGSEEEVEACAKEAYEELKASFENDEATIDDIDSAELLSITSLVVKLVEKGKIEPEQAEEILATILKD